VVGQSKEDISDCKVLRDVAMATKVWPKQAQISHNFSCMWHIQAEFGFGIGFVLLANSSVTLSYTRDKGRLLWQPIFGLKLLQMHFYK